MIITLKLTLTAISEATNRLNEKRSLHNYIREDFGCCLMYPFKLSSVPVVGDMIRLKQLSDHFFAAVVVEERTYDLDKDAWIISCSLPEDVLSFDEYVAVTEELDYWQVMRVMDLDLGTEDLESRHRDLCEEFDSIIEKTVHSKKAVYEIVHDEDETVDTDDDNEEDHL